MAVRGLDPFDKKSMALSAGLHLALIVFAWASTSTVRDDTTFITFEIEMVSPPPAAQAEEVREAAEELVVERPDPEPPPPDPEPEVEEVVPVEVPEEEPEPPPPEPEEPVEVQPVPAEEVTVAATPEAAPDEPPAESGEGINVRIEGLRRDYPAYYENIIRQIQRCLRWRDGGRWSATIRFVIGRDGTASSVAFETRSGNPAFDFEALGAVECAGKGRFGPLPEDLPWDRQPIRFEFRPPGELQEQSLQVGRPTEVTNQ